MPELQMELPRETLREFCKRWKITAFYVFGSILRDDFRPESDVDVLVDYAPDARWSLLDHVRMEEDLAEVLHRPVDILNRRTIERSENPYRKKEILGTAQA